MPAHAEAVASEDVAAPTGAKRLLLIGSPNSGKSTLFNRLTRGGAKVANYPGVTVETYSGTVGGTQEPTELIDLPGTYSLEAISPDEEIAVRLLEGPPIADGVLVVVDATTLPRSMPLVGEVLRFGRPTMLVLTMVDELKARGGSVDLPRLSKELGIPVVGIVGHRGLGLDDLKPLLDTPHSWARPVELPPSESRERFSWADAILDRCLKDPSPSRRATDLIDRFVLHPIVGSFLFFAVMFLFFQLIFTWTGPAMDAVEGSIGWLGEAVGEFMAEGWFRSLIVDGVIGGVGGVLVFLPQILAVLLVINLLESTGYLARAAFSIDRVMGWAGLEGRCFVALLSSYACAVPGIMAARTVPDPKSRLATILVAPFMTCAARLPVYTLLVTGFVPDETVWGGLHLRGLVMFGLYLLGSLSALVVAAILQRGLLRGKAFPFTMELPPYRLPMMRVVVRQTWWGVRAFLKKAGTIILLASILLWALLNFPASEVPSDSDVSPESYQLENSYAASLGKTIEPVIEPLGFDWKIGIGLIASLAAREVVVASLAQIYAFDGEEDDVLALSERMKLQTHPQTGEQVYGLPTVLSLLVFFVFALQCISTLAVMKRETNGWGSPVFALVLMTAMAWAGSFVTYRLTQFWIG